MPTRSRTPITPRMSPPTAGVLVGRRHRTPSDLRVLLNSYWWAAFERRGDPPPRALDRDHEFIAQLRAQLPAAQTPWQQAVEQMLADVARTTSLSWAWQVTIRDSTPDRAEPRPSLSVRGRSNGDILAVVGHG